MPRLFFLNASQAEMCELAYTSNVCINISCVLKPASARLRLMVFFRETYVDEFAEEFPSAARFVRSVSS